MFKIFSKKPPIKQITSCSSGDLLFNFGLGADGLVYVWNATFNEWRPHIVKQPGQGPAPAPTESNPPSVPLAQPKRKAAPKKAK